MLPFGTSAVFDEVAFSVSAVTGVSRSPMVKLTGTLGVSSLVVTLAIAVIVGASFESRNATIWTIQPDGDANDTDALWAPAVATVVSSTRLPIGVVSRGVYPAPAPEMAVGVNEAASSRSLGHDV